MKTLPRVILTLLTLLLVAACVTTPPATPHSPSPPEGRVTPPPLEGEAGRGSGLPLIAERGALFSGAGVCATCHTGSVDEAGKDVALDSAWRASVHANAARDPYWLATVRSEITLAPALSADLQKKCATCHMPMAEVTLAKDKQPVTILDGGLASPANALHALAVDGVSCTACHQIEPEGLGKPQSFNGGFVINTQLPQGQRLAYGPYPADDASVAMMQAVSGFIPKEGKHLAQSEMCGACHNLYTPYLNSAGQVAGEFAEQLIFSEWQNSAYAASKTCQACHMPAAQGAVKSSITGGQARQPFLQHTFTGGNVTLLRMLSQNGAALRVTASAQQFNAAAQAATDLLAMRSTPEGSQTARLTLTNPRVEGGRLLAEVAVESLVGHKFPAGYPSRRAWLHIRVLDKDGKVVFESGAAGANGAIAGNDNDADPARFEPHYTQITAPDQVQIYEGILATTEGKVTTQLLRAAGYLKDNRLLPAGFKPNPAIPEMSPQGEAAQDANFTAGGDRLSLALGLGQAAGPFTLEARLLYQPIGYRWAENLAAEPGAEQAAFKQMLAGTSNLPLVAASARAVVAP